MHDIYAVNLRHLSIGKRLTELRFDKYRYRCPHCGEYSMQEISFQARGTGSRRNCEFVAGITLMRCHVSVESQVCAICFSPLYSIG
ncbi:MAG: transposase family protein [Spirochaetales bacterium]|nr:transposase family protein [Spirochaetales bacterium]